MNDADAKALGLRALAAGFEWAAGCLDGADAVRLLVNDAGHWLYFEYWGEAEWYTGHAANCLHRMWPDFRDPATTGVLTAQVRAIHPDRGVTLQRHAPPLLVLVDGPDNSEPDPGEWEVVIYFRSGCGIAGSGPTEAHALVAALEAANGRDALGGR